MQWSNTGDKSDKSHQMCRTAMSISVPHFSGVKACRWLNKLQAALGKQSCFVKNFPLPASPLINFGLGNKDETQ